MITTATVNEVRRLYSVEGLTTVEIGEIIGKSKSTVSRICKKHGIMPAHRKNPTYRMIPGVSQRKYGKYIGVYRPDHPNANVEGYVLEHVYIMTQIIGRPLRKDEVVHHINGDPSDNRVVNLMLMKREDHSRLHKVKYWRRVKAS